MQDLIYKDLKHIWHPCSQMKDYETFHPLIIDSAEDAYLILKDGRRIIDAISSWWCKSLGHGHPRLHAALLQQAQRFEHVLLANTTNDIIVELSQQLATLIPRLTRIHYASEGSSAVEIALKMSLHSRINQGESKRTQLAALCHGYHGETLGACAVSDLGLYRNAYHPWLLNVHFIDNIPYVSNYDDPLWQDCSPYWPNIVAKLEPLASELTAIIVEPIVQGAGGMKIYSQDFLKRLRQWTQERGIHLIADEIMTGFGRTGLPLASQHANIIPDFICLGKNLTAGWLPFSAVLTTEEIYQIFYDDYATGKAFLHSHTFSGHVLGAAVALECLKIYVDEQIYERIPALNQQMTQAMHSISAKTGKLKNIRGIGGLVAADLIVPDTTQRAGYQLYQTAVTLGALLRPLGNTVYWLPPLNCSSQIIQELEQITLEALLQQKF